MARGNRGSRCGNRRSGWRCVHPGDRFRGLGRRRSRRLRFGNDFRSGIPFGSVLRHCCSHGCCGWSLRNGADVGTGARLDGKQRRLLDPVLVRNALPEVECRCQRPDVGRAEGCDLPIGADPACQERCRQPLADAPDAGQIVVRCFACLLIGWRVALKRSTRRSIMYPCRTQRHRMTTAMVEFE